MIHIARLLPIRVWVALSLVLPSLSAEAVETLPLHAENSISRRAAPTGGGIISVLTQQDGTIVGTVTDAGGRGLPGVTLTLSGPAQRTVVTDPEGRYRLTGLPPGTYEVQAELDAFAAEAVGRIEVAAGSTVTIDITLPLVIAEEITVRGTPPGRYHVDSTNSATRTNVPFIKLPRAVVAIPEQIILDQAATDISEVYHNVSGVHQEDGFGGIRDDYNIRGFRRSQTYEDGHRLSFDGRIVMTNVERVEVLKGPASLFGQVRPGGIINVIASGLSRLPAATCRRPMGSTGSVEA